MKSGYQYWLIHTPQGTIVDNPNKQGEAMQKQFHRSLPVHSYLLAEKGVMFIEQLFLEELATDKVYEFAFIAAPLKLRGASGSPVRPLALPYAK